MEKTRKKSMVPEFLRTRKTYMLTAIIVTIIGILSLSYAFFSRQSLIGETSNNTINVQTVEGTSQSFVTTYENASNEVKTGLLNLTDTPYTKMSKFAVHNIYNEEFNVTINWDYVTSTLIQSDTSYNLYECTETNFGSATLANVGSNCDLVSPISGNVLPLTGQTTKLQSATDITLTADQTRYYVAVITIGISNDGKSFQGVIKVKDRFFHILQIDYDNGSEIISMDMSNGDSITLPTITKTGYTFDRWDLTENYNSSLVGSSFTMGSEDTSLKAIWTANTYTVTYNCNGGTNSVISSTHTYGTASPLTVDACYYVVPTATGVPGMIYSIVGWSKNSDGSGDLYNNGEMVTDVIPLGNQDLYVVWVPLFSYSSSYKVLSDYSFSNVPGDWKIRLLSNGNLTINHSLTIDVFLVGGGGGGGGASHGGGGGGYTRTERDVLIEVDTYPVIVGSGGTAVPINGGNGSNGNLTSAFNYTASGGGGGANYKGGTGGSGGGSASNLDASAKGGNGGSNGGDGAAGANGRAGGYGQIKTIGPNSETGNTKEFGEAVSTILYAGGGGGTGGSSAGGGAGGSGGGGTGGVWAGACAGSGATNTGGGGGGGTSWCASGSGGSGIVVIRNARY